MYKLRDYQKECVDTVNSLPEGSRSVVALATGLGKTVCARHFDRMGGRMLILSHRDDLVRQPLKYFENSGIKYGIEKAGEHSSPDDEVVSASVQTLSREKRLHQFPKDYFSLIVVDEAHHAAAPTYRRILDYFSAKKVIGLTATPRRGDGVALDTVFDSICFERDILWGIEHGYLSKIRSKIINVSDIDLSKVTIQAGDFNPAQLSDAIDNDRMYKAIAQTYFRYARDRHTIIFCLSVKACEAVQKEIRKGLDKKDRQSVQIILGDTPIEKRHKIEADFLAGRVRVLINCLVLTEGTDMPIADCIIIGRPSVNASLYTQMVGRGTRKLPRGEGQKDYCLVLDIVPQSKRNLCNAYSLSGLDYDAVRKKYGDKIKPRAGTDIFELAKEIRKEEERKNSPLYIYEVEYDLFAKLIEDQLSVVKTGIENDDLGSRVADTIKDESGLDFIGLHYELNAGSDDRYEIHAGPGESFLISEPDMLNKVDVKAYIGGISYKTLNKVKFTEIIRLIKRWLKTNRDDQEHAFYWDDKKVEKWEREDASDKQRELIAKQLEHLGVVGTARIRNKYEAHITIDYLNGLIENVNRQEAAKDKVETLKVVADGQGEQPQLPALTYEPLSPLLLPEKYGYALQFSVQYRCYYGSDPATDKQRSYAASLWKTLVMLGVKADCDVDGYIAEGTKQALTAYIDIFNGILEQQSLWRSKERRFMLNSVFSFIRDHREQFGNPHRTAIIRERGGNKY